MEHLTEAELQSWIDREVEPEERARISRHLEDCAHCRLAAASLRSAAEVFSDAMLRYDDFLADRTDRPAARPIHVVEPARRAFAVPRWASRAAAVVLLLGAAAAAAMVPGSPLRALFTDSAPEPFVVAPAPGAAAGSASSEAGARLTVRPHDGRLTVRIESFAPGTRVRVTLFDGPEAVVSLPDGAENARFIVASGRLDVIGSDESDDRSPGVGVVELRLPRSLQVGVVELDGSEVVRVTTGRLITQRQISREGDQAVFEVGG